MNGYSTITEMKAINYMKKKNIPFAMYINGGVVRKETKIKAKIKKHFLSSAFTYFSPCLEADEYLKHYGVKEELIHHYPYSTFYEREIVSGPMSDIEKNRIREEFELPKGKLYVSAGQFIDRKNNLLLISLFNFMAALMSVLLLYFVEKTGRYILGYVITTVAVFMGVFALLYFGNAGIEGALPYFFVFSII